MSEILNTEKTDIEKKVTNIEHFQEEWFDGFWTYEVQWNENETLFSIVIELIRRNIDNSDKTLLRNIFINNAVQSWYFRKITKWQEIFFNIIPDKGYSLNIWNISYDLFSDKFKKIGKDLYNINEDDSFVNPGEYNYDPDKSSNIDEYEGILEDEKPEITEEKVDKIISKIRTEINSSYSLNQGWIKYINTLSLWDSIKWELPRDIELDPVSIKTELKRVLLWKDINSLSAIN